MVTKTALITLGSTLLIAILALSVEKSRVHLGPTPDPATLTGASTSWSADGGRGNWGSGEHDEHEGGWEGDDD